MLEQEYEQEIDTKFYMCPEGEYPLQCTDVRLREATSDKVKVVWCNIDLVWEVLDDNVKRTLNMDKLTVTQQLMADLVLDSNGDIAVPVRLDWGTNKNSRLKNVLVATGLQKSNFSLNKLKFQSVLGKVKHEADRQGATNADGTPVAYARVVSVAPLSRR